MATSPHPDGFPDRLVAEALAAARALPLPTPVFAIAGLQGSGKSTLAAQVAARARSEGLRVAVLSLDDLYLTRAQRQRLALDVHPLLATRGPPGTHDLALALETFAALRRGHTRPLPRFDKAGDDRLAPEHWADTSAPLDLLVFEGWCLGVPAESEDALREPLNPLERDEDPDGRWRRWCNAALARDYPPLWAHVDVLWFLQPRGFETVHAWRGEQERALQAAHPDRTGMDGATLDRFIQHYERVSRQALRTMPGIADACVALDSERQPLHVRLRQPG